MISWSSQLRQKHLMHVLHRPVEPADIIIHIKWTSRLGSWRDSTMDISMDNPARIRADRKSSEIGLNEAT